MQLIRLTHYDPGLPHLTCLPNPIPSRGLNSSPAFRLARQGVPSLVCLLIH
jgi:hypothetical protein